MAMFHLLKIRTSIDIFKNEKCKVTFGLEYIYILKLWLTGVYIILLIFALNVRKLWLLIRTESMRRF